MSPQFTRNFIVQTVGKALSVILGLFVLSLLTRSLGAEKYGAFTTAFTFLQFFGVIVDFGLTLTLVVMLSEPGADQKKITGNVFTLRLVSAGVLFLTAPFLVLLFPWSPTVNASVAAGAMGYVFMAAAAMLVGVFQTHQNVWRASLAELIDRVALLAFCLYAAHKGMGAEAMMWAHTAAHAIWLAVALWFAGKFVPVRLRFDLSSWKEILRRSWPMGVSIFFNLLYLKGDILILSLFRSEAEVGNYGAAYRVLDVLTVIPTIFMGLLLPNLVRDWKQGNAVEFRQHLARAFDAFALMYLPVVAGAWALSVPLLRLVAGDEFIAAGGILKLLILAVPSVFLGTLYGHAVVAVDRQRTMMLGYLACAVLSLAGYFFFIPAYGMVGAAGVTIFAESFIALTTFALVRSASKGRPNAGVFLRAALASLLMYAVLRLLPGWHVLVLIPVGGAVYAAFLFAFGVLTPQRIRDLMPRKLAAHKPT